MHDTNQNKKMNNENKIKLDSVCFKGDLDQLQYLVLADFLL